jgi:nicotinate-nucleotide adenylyltransferase
VRLGILGGTFDPVHSGHVSMARAATAAARLDRLIMIPCAQPPHKERQDLTNAYHRFGMLALLVTDLPFLRVSPVELKRGGRSFSVDTLAELARRWPDADHYLVVGSDSFAELPTWRRHEEILSRAAVIVVPRHGMEPDSLRSQLPPELAEILRPPGAPWPDHLAGNLPFAGLVDSPALEISSTEIRRRVAQGQPIANMVPPPVENYINRQGLYA